MCGLAGIFNHNITNQDSIIIKNMIHLLRHRGPEESGLYIDDYIALAHARLSIIDLPEGTQPIHNENKTLWIIFNGEIFNYPDLREVLIKSGHKFYTKTDTEVIIHLYEEYGVACLQKLNGQFAFAIWNSVSNTLFIARDRVGIIPLFYSVMNNVFTFASEIKALFADPSLDRKVNYKSLDQIFTFWTTSGNQTFFEGIYELPPAHYILLKKDELKIERYWEIKFTHENNYSHLKKEELIDSIDDILTDAVKIRLRSDVPVGSYLSGGLDSSGITSIIKNNFNNKLNTFGIRFEDQTFDEGTFQSEMVNFLSVDHTDIIIKDEDIGNNFELSVWHTEKPLLRTAPVPLLILSSLVHQKGYKVVLTGEGSDEIFGGYNIFKEAKIRKFWSKYPESKMRPLLLEKLYPYVFRDPRTKNTLMSFFKAGITDIQNPFFSHIIRWNNTSRIKKFFSDEMNSQLKDYDVFLNVLNMLPEEFNEWDYLAKAQYLEISIFMSNYLLSSQGDRMSMANSVEIRVPFLDHRLIELMAMVNPDYKINLLNEKFILKKVFKNKLPSGIINRPKNPYRAPIKNGLLNSESRLVENYLTAPEIKKTGLFNFNKIDFFLKKLNNAEYAISETDAMTLTGLLSTQIVYNKFISSFNINYPENHHFDKVFDYRNSEVIKE